MGGRELRGRIDELLERFGLAQAAGRVARTYSGGMQRKLDVAMGLVHRPRVLFLDEPTTGLDPEARAELWAEIERLAHEDGLTILLTTHYLEEADRLASRLAIVDRGRVVASGTPDDLKSELRGDAIVVELADGATDGQAIGVLRRVPGLAESLVDGRSLRARVERGATAVPAVLSALEARRHRRRIGHGRPPIARRRLPPPHRPGLPADRGVLRMTAIAQSYYMTQRHARQLLRQPWFVVITLVQPVIWLLLFGSLFRSVTEIPGFATAGTYLDYLVPGIIVMTALMSSGWSGMGVIEDIDRGLLDRFLAGPTHRSSLIVGRIGYEAIELVIQGVIMGGLAWLLGAQLRRRADRVRRADRRGGARGLRVRLAVVRHGADPAPAGVGHRREHDADPAAHLPLGCLHPAGAGARVDRDRRALQPGELGDRGGPRGTPRQPRLVVHRTTRAGARGRGAPEPRAGRSRLPGLPALRLSTLIGVLPGLQLRPLEHRFLAAYCGSGNVRPSETRRPKLSG